MESKRLYVDDAAFSLESYVVCCSYCYIAVSMCCLWFFGLKGILESLLFIYSLCIVYPLLSF